MKSQKILFVVTLCALFLQVSAFFNFFKGKTVKPSSTSTTNEFLTRANELKASPGVNRVAALKLKNDINSYKKMHRVQLWFKLQERIQINKAQKIVKDLLFRDPEGFMVFIREEVNQISSEFSYDNKQRITSTLQDIEDFKKALSRKDKRTYGTKVEELKKTAMSKEKEIFEGPGLLEKMIRAYSEFDKNIRRLLPQTGDYSKAAEEQLTAELEQIKTLMDSLKFTSAEKQRVLKRHLESSQNLQIAIEYLKGATENPHKDFVRRFNALRKLVDDMKKEKTVTSNIFHEHKQKLAELAAYAKGNEEEASLLQEARTLLQAEEYELGSSTGGSSTKVDDIDLDVAPGPGEDKPLSSVLASRPAPPGRLRRPRQ